MHKIVNGGKVVYQGNDARRAMVAYLSGGGAWSFNGRPIKGEKKRR